MTDVQPEVAAEGGATEASEETAARNGARPPRPSG